MEVSKVASLETKVLGMTFPNPFVLASGPPTANASMIIEGFKAGWGGVTLKTIGLVPTPMPSPRIHANRTGQTKWGMFDIELFSDMPIERWEDDIDRIRDAFPERPIIASVAGGGKPHEWQEVVRRLEPHGVDAFEMNTSCPNISDDDDRGSKLGQDAEMLALAVSWMKEATDLPVIAKLTPNVTDIVPLARAAVEAGADGFTTTNSLVGLGKIDLDTFAPGPVVDGIGMPSGYGGPGLRPVSLRCTADVVQAQPQPVFGCGGISKWQDAAEYLAVGSPVVQVCTAVMWDGYKIITRLTRGLSAYLDKHGYESVAEIVGKGLPAGVKM